MPKMVRVNSVAATAKNSRIWLGRGRPCRVQNTEQCMPQVNWINQKGRRHQQEFAHLAAPRQALQCADQAAGGSAENGSRKFTPVPLPPPPTHVSSHQRREPQQ